MASKSEVSLHNDHFRRSLMFRKSLLLLCSLIFLAFGVAFAQDAPVTTEEPASTPEAPATTPEPATTEQPSSSTSSLTGPAIASGLNNPRHISFASDGTLYIAEAGKGGDTEAQGPYGAVKAGQTAQISAVSPDGTQSVVVPDLVSMDAGFGQIEGPTSVLATDDSLWITLGMGTQDPIADGALTEVVVQLDKATGEVKQSIDLRTFENENNPDQGPELVSNPADLAIADDGTLYIVDASGNSLLTWTEADGLKLFASWPVAEENPQAVPTSIDFGPDGDIYVGFLSGFPFPPQGARIERYSPDGTLKETYPNMTLVTDILVADDGTVYAVQLADGFGDAGYNANSGSVVKIVNGEMSVVLAGLNYPYGLAQDKDGNLFVTADSAFVSPDLGSVVPVGGK
jgi:glucose/arabinose dehydrogenase